MKSVALQIFLLLPFFAHGQARIETIDAKAKLSSTDSIHYPIIKTGNALVDERINKTIRDTILNAGFFNKKEKITTVDLIDSAISYGVIVIFWDSTFNQKGFLSLQVYQEAVSAYLSTWTKYFNFDLRDGHLLSMKELIKTNLQSQFRNLISKKKSMQIDSAINNLKHNYTASDDSAVVRWAIKIMLSCKTNNSMQKFYIVPDGIVIVDDCDFPHVIQSMAPDLVLTLHHDELLKYLNESVYRKIVKQVH